MERPIGGEFVSLVKNIVNLQQELKTLNPESPLLKCAIKDTGGSVEYPPAFGKRFKGKKLNVALGEFYKLLESELNRLSFVKWKFN